MQCLQIDSEVAASFYKIARPDVQPDEDEPFYNDLGRLSPEPMVATVDPTLSQAEEEIVVEMVRRAGQVGIEVGDSGRFLVWKEAAPKTFGQTTERVSDQLSLKIPNTGAGGHWRYPPICTFAGNYSNNLINL